MAIRVRLIGDLRRFVDSELVNIEGGSRPSPQLLENLPGSIPALAKSFLISREGCTTQWCS